MKDDAVSAPVGVMLLLAITIVIGGIIAAFAFGAIGNSSTELPAAEFSTSVTGAGENLTLVFEHKSGQPLNTSDLKVTTFIRTQGEEESVGSFSAENLYMSGKKILSGTWTAGMKLTLPVTEGNARLLGTEKEKILDAAKKATPMDVKIYYIPSGKIIYNSSFILQEKNT